MTVLVTGFEPFGGMPHNPSHALLEHLPKSINGAKVVTATLPVDTNRVQAVLSDLYQQHRPSAALHLGLAAGRQVISLERVALNLLDFELPDNQGNHRQDQPILPRAPFALPSRLPLRAIQKAWQEAHIPCVVSNSAGLYLCNQVMFLALASLPEAIPAGFIHLPADETLAASRPQPHVPLSEQVRAVHLAAEVVVASL